MPITTLPAAPSRAEPSTFSDKADALLGALDTFVTEANALETNVNAKEVNTNADAIATAADRVQTGLDRVATGEDVIAAAASAASAVAAPGTNATSTTSATIGTGNKTITIEASKDIVVGMQVVIAETATPTNYMAGTVTAYNSGTGALTVNVTSTNGSSTAEAWTVSLSGARGATGETGAAGAKGDTGSLATISRGGTVYNSTGIPNTALNIDVWRATVACTVTNVRGKRTGGTGATINARRKGSENHLASALSLTGTSWADGGAVQNTALEIGDSLEIMVVGTVGTVTQIAIQVDFTVP